MMRVLYWLRLKLLNLFTKTVVVKHGHISDGPGYRCSARGDGFRVDEWIDGAGVYRTSGTFAPEK